MAGDCAGGHHGDRQYHHVFGGLVDLEKPRNRNAIMDANHKGKPRIQTIEIRSGIHCRSTQNCVETEHNGGLTDIRF